MIELEAIEYPIPTDHLRKGDRIERADIEHAFGVKADTKAYRLALMRAKNHVERRFLERGEPVTIAEDDGALMILTDSEAAVYNNDAVWSYVRRAARALSRQRVVNRANLTSEQRDTHDRALEVNGRAIAAARREQRRPVLRAEERKTPLLK